MEENAGEGESLGPVPIEGIPLPPAGGTAYDSLSRQADDPEAARRAVDDASSSAAALWITFITFGTYLVITVGSVTHRQLFLEEPIKLPLLDVQLPLVAFFWLAPILFLIFHAYLLFNLLQLADRIRRYDALLGETLLSQAQTDRIRLQLPGFVFVQFLAVPRSEQKGIVNRLPGLIAWITVVGGPVLLLLFIQIQFLPYHSLWVTWIHRVALAVDVLVLLWLLWPKIVEERRPRGRFSLARRVAATLTFVMIVFSLYIVIFPGEPQENNPLTSAWIPVPFQVLQSAPKYSADNLDADDPFSALNVGEIGDSTQPADATKTLERLSGEEWSDLIARCEAIKGAPEKYGEAAEKTCGAVDLHPRRLAWLSPYRALLAGSVNEITGTPTSLWSNTLVLSDKDFVDDETLAKLAAADSDGIDSSQGERTRSFRGRDLRNAYLVRADLRRADFTGATLDGANLGQAHLEGALFGCAVTRSKKESGLVASMRKEQGSMSAAPGAPPSDCAELREASLDSAFLQGASLNSAQLQGASFVSAHLQGASLDLAQLQGATFFLAELQGTSLEKASLLGASLSLANAQGASLAGADIRAASLSYGYFQGAAFGDANLRGASFQGSQLEGATFDGADLQGTLLVGVNLWRASGMEGAPLLAGSSYVPTEDASGQVRGWLGSIPVKAAMESARGRLDVLVQQNSGSEDDLRRLDLTSKAEDLDRAATAYSGEFREAVTRYACDGDEAVVAAVQGRITNLVMTDFDMFDDIQIVPKVATELLACPVAARINEETRSRLRLLSTLAINSRY